MNATRLKGEAKTREGLIQWITEVSESFDFSYPAEVTLQRKKDEASYRAVFWIWCRHMTKELQEKWPNAYPMLDKKGQIMHDMLCQMFLESSKPVKVGKKTINPRQRTWTDLQDNCERYDFLRRIDEWSMEIGVPLPQPPSEYQRDKTRQTA